MVGMDLHDTTVTCSECGQEFTFSALEQQAFARKGQRPPTQCAFCRAARMIASGGTGARESSGNSGEHGDRSRQPHILWRCANAAENKPKYL